MSVESVLDGKPAPALTTVAVPAQLLWIKFHVVHAESNPIQTIFNNVDGLAFHIPSGTEYSQINARA